MYENHARIHIVPMIGRRNLSKFTKRDVEAFRTQLVTELSRPMARKVFTSFKAVLRHGASASTIEAARAIKIGKVKRDSSTNRVVIPEASQMRLILEGVNEKAAAEPESKWPTWKVYLHAAVLTGLRASELRGLNWGNVNVPSMPWYKAEEGPVLRVRQRADEFNVVSTHLKSEMASRDVAAPDTLAGYLRGMFLRQGRPAEDVLVFGTATGKRERLSNIYSGAWRPLMRTLGIPYFKMHALRHYFASRMIRNGASPKDLQVALGDHSIEIVFNIYGHLFAEDKPRRLERANQLEAELLWS